MKLKFITLALSMLLLIPYIAGCSQTNANNAAALSLDASGTTQTNAGASSDAEKISLSSNVSNSDMSTAWDKSATQITLNGPSASVTGSGAEASGSVITITQAGTYVVTGVLENGQIKIAATNKDKVYLILNGVDITNKTGAPIDASQCDKLIVTLADGTQNTLTDGGTSFQYADTVNEEPNAALFCKDDLTINGTGELTVNAGFNNGIGTKDDLLIVSGSITINAVNHGLRGNDSITIFDGSFNITAGNDGIQTNNTEDSSLGWILIEGGIFGITSAHDGIQADTTISISGGQFNITSGGQTASADTTPDSYKGIKAAGDISITSGSFIIESMDDAVHANGNIAVSGGNLSLSTGDDGIHADGDLTITGSSTIIDVLTSYEGLEAKTMTISGGVINVYATDDGINVAGGADQSGMGGRFGGDRFSSANSDQWLKITGGTITVIAGRDGIDVNGSGEMTDGDVNITAATLGEGNTIDSDGSFTRTGGNLTESGGNAPGGPGAGGGMQPGGGNPRGRGGRDDEDIMRIHEQNLY